MNRSFTNQLLTLVVVASFAVFGLGLTQTEVSARGKRAVASKGDSGSATTSQATGSGGQPNGRVDLNADGRTDYVVVRALGTGAAASSRNDSRFGGSRRERYRERSTGTSSLQGAGTPIEWWGLNSNDFGVNSVQWGDAALDYPLVADFDGDGRDDITVWRPAGKGEFAYFYSINSRDYTLRATAFGQALDDPYTVGDYDGDGVDDPSVFRCPETPGTCYFYWQASKNPSAGFYAAPFGYGAGTDLLPFAGDFNGDGKRDFAVQGASPNNPNNGIFYIGMNGGTSVTGVEWGLFTDRLVSGDFDGDGKSDITVTRPTDGVIWWYVLEQDGGTRFYPWGAESDYEAPGDYDGDGSDDFAVYRSNSTDAVFWVQPSNGSTHFAMPWGQPGDIPVSYLFVQ